ncbi:ribosomal RNA processing protein 1 homolog B-like [Saccoglossus kowalevskii]
MASTLKNYSVEVHFAQRLAASEKKIRDKAVKRLRSWITIRSQSEKNDFSEDDLMKIWKGLFYCVWMSDKLLIQQALVENIATLVYSFKSQKSVMLYIRTFYKTMMREWLGIDHLRIDKYYKLVRKMLNHSFEMIKKSEWKPEVIDEFVDVMKTTVLTLTQTLQSLMVYDSTWLIFIWLNYVK